ncbi:MAG: S8 family serine peptidase [bacterium]
MRKLLLPAALVCALGACSDATYVASPVTPFAPSAAALSKAAAVIPGQYIVRFRTGALTPLQNAMSVQQVYGGVVERVYASALNGAVIHLSESAAAALRLDPRVEAIEQDQIFTAQTVQNNPPSWGLDRIDQRNRPLSASYSYGPTGSGVTAYIIDTGINFAQADFNGRASGGFDAITAGGNASDCYGHGTHVAGTVGSTTYGVAKAVKLVAVRVMDCAGNGSSSSVLAGIDWVTQHAVRPAVANMSLGGGSSLMIDQAVEASIAAGITYAVSAGNNTTDACTQSPASAPDAITVGATDNADAFAYFSNYGNCVDINAPGMNITSLWIGASGATNTISGTSMATPHVAGAIALFLQNNPAATPAQVRTALISNATPSVLSGVPASTPNLLLYTGFLINSGPIAKFTSSCVLLTCSLDASTSSALPTATYAWTFGDGSTAAGTTASRTYAAAGSYAITLSITDANGTNSATSSVVVTAPVNQLPTATISTPAVSASFTPGASVSFSGAGTDPEDGTLTGASLVWASSLNGQIGTGTAFATSALIAGTHTITLTAKDSKGATRSATRVIVITAVPANQPPVATFSYNCNTGIVRQCSMNGTASSDDHGVVSYRWDWGNGRSETHSYGTSKNTWATGTYLVKLTVTDGSGLTSTVTQSVTIP